MKLSELLNWRYATKRMTGKTVPREKLDYILEAARMAPSSSGLQPYEVFLISNRAMLERIKAISFNQSQITECSHLLVFAAWDSYSDEKIDKVYDHHTDVRDLPKGRFSSYTDKIKEMYGAQTPEEHFAHTARQTYIALGLAMAQAAELKVDSTPAEGFSNEVVDEILGLGNLGLKSVSLLYIGYRDEKNDWLSHMKKVRIPMEEFIIKM